MIKRIAVTGPESTGKSWLAANLADEFSEPWVPEFARAYLGKLEQTLRIIMIFLKLPGGSSAQKKHWQRLQKNGFSVILISWYLRIWCLVKFGRSHAWIDQMADEHIYSHYLLCNTDLPWESDPLREHPHLRQELFDMYKSELEKRELPYTIVSGMGYERLKMAIDGIMSFQKDSGNNDKKTPGGTGNLYQGNV